MDTNTKNYHDRVFDKLSSNGHDVVADALGLHTVAHVYTPGDKSHIAMKMKPTTDMSPEEFQKKLAAYSLVHGLLLKQESIGHHRALPANSPQEADGLEIHTIHPPDREQVLLANEAIDKRLHYATLLHNALEKRRGGNNLISHKQARVYALSTPHGIRYVNKTGLPQDVFHQAVDGGVSAIMGKQRLRPFKMEGNHFANDWQEYPNGEKYREQLNQLGLDEQTRQRLDGIIGTLQPQMESLRREHFGDGDGRTPDGAGKYRVVPDDVRRNHRLTHYAGEPTSVIAANRYGLGEVNRNIEGAIPRSYAHFNEGVPHPEGEGLHKHDFNAHAALYDLGTDANGYWQQAAQSGFKENHPDIHNFVERNIKRDGFDGYYNKNSQSPSSVALFHDTHLQPNGTGEFHPLEERQVPQPLQMNQKALSNLLHRLKGRLPEPRKTFVVRVKKCH